jgi:O-antigen/teichoic acid export membrane protein
MKGQFKHILSNNLIRNYFKVFSVDVLVKGAGIILLPVYLKLMTQEEFGLYGYLIAIIGTFSLVCNLGVYVAQSKLYQDYPEEKRGSVLFTLNIMLFIFLTVLFTLLFILDLDYRVVEFLFKTDFNYSEYRAPVLVGVIVAVYSLMLTNYFLTSDKIGKVQLFNISRIILINVVVIAILFLHSESDLTLLRLKYSFAVELIIIFSFSVFYIREMKYDFDPKIAVRAIKISMPIVASAFIGLFINLSDRYFIEKFGTLRDLSIYNVALTIAGVVPFVFASFQNIWLPHFLKEKDLQKNRIRSRKMVIRLLILFVLMSGLILAVLRLMLAWNIVDEKYQEILLLLPIVLATSIVTSIITMFSNHLIYLDKLYLVIVVGLPLSILAVSLNMVLVPALNIYGAALSALIVNLGFLIAYSILVDYIYKKKIMAEAL